MKLASCMVLGGFLVILSMLAVGVFLTISTTSSGIQLLQRNNQKTPSEIVKNEKNN